MTSEKLQAWIEIPPLASPPVSVGEWLLLMWPWWVLLGCVGLLLWWLLRQPRLRFWYGLLGIRRALLHQRVSERQALFALAQRLQAPALQSMQKTLPEELRHALALRFHSAAPSHAAVLSVIQRLQTWNRG
ncbi:MAG: hypothetical protein OEX12_00940 [Gammaproteobacteria bacterium]|nr:hypothetical protein [Gammaproteobacteria bacterium]